MISVEEIEEFLRHVEEVEHENARLKQLIADHHNVSRLQRLHVGDTCPICQKAGFPWSR